MTLKQNILSIFLFIILSPVAFAANPGTTTADCSNDSNLPAFYKDLQKLTTAGCENVHPTRDEIKTILKKTLSEHTFALKRKINLYHYGINPTKNPGPVGANDLELAEKYFYNKESNRSFFNPDKGYSLYMANNPIVSLDYSKDPALLLRLTLPEGIRYLKYDDLKMNAEDSAKVFCFFYPKGITNLQFNPLANGTLNPLGLMRDSQEAQKLFKETFGELKIQMLLNPFRRNVYKECVGDNPEIKIIDPSLSSQIKKTVFSPEIESDPSPEKIKSYQELLEFFDMTDGLEITAIKNSVEPKFWQYYKAWAPVIYKLPPGTDLVKFHNEQVQKMKPKRANLISEMFGCSNDPEHKDEILKPSNNP